MAVMNILLVQQSSYMPTHGGANKANRFLLETLVSQGHTCAALGPADPDWVPEAVDAQWHQEGETQRFTAHGVRVVAVTERAALITCLKAQIQRQQPDWVLVSSEDPGQFLLGAALEAAPNRVLYLAHTTLVLPFGPGGFVNSSAKADLLARCAGIITVSQFMKRYIHQYGGMEAVVFQPPLYGTPPFSHFDNASKGKITLINPCAYKGIDIFADLARQRPNLAFGAVPTWGTSAEDEALLATLPNVTVIPARDNIDDIFAETRILLVPSLWHEAFGRVCVEAMLRGIPVVAADIGGLPEAMLGMDHCISVRPIGRYKVALGNKGLPAAEVPAQELGPWLDALDRLTHDAAYYRQLAHEGREAAHAYLDGLSLQPLINYLETLKPGVLGRVVPESQEPAQDPVAAKRQARLANLSPAQRALLAKRLKNRNTQYAGDLT